jgi:hypothetical protein
VLENPGVGLYGAIVVGPPGATYRGTGWAVDVFPKSGAPYRDVSLFFQDADEGIGNHRMPYTTSIRGDVGLNYASAPLDVKAKDDPGTAAAFRAAVASAPSTPRIEAFAGDAMRIHVLAPWSEQAQVFSIEGHEWPTEPGREGTNVVSSVQLGGLEAITLDLAGGAGGVDHVPGDYVYGDHRGPYLEAGLWGLFSVHAKGETVAGLEPLTTGGSSTPIAVIVAVAAAVIALFALAALLLRRRRLRASS